MNPVPSIARTSSTQNSEPPQIEKNTKEVADVPMKQTNKKIKCISHPRFPFFIKGMKCIRDEKYSTPSESREARFGLLTINQTPSWFVFEIGTIVSDLAENVFCARHKKMDVTWAENNINKDVGLLKIILKERSPYLQEFFNENPGELFTIGFIELAFQSRVLPGRSVRTIQYYNEKDIDAQEGDFKHYLNSLTLMKLVIQNLHLPEEDRDEAWNVLMYSICKMKKYSKSKFSAATKEKYVAINILLNEAQVLSEAISKDSVFQNKYRNLA